MHPFVQALREEMAKVANPEKAGPMQAYMKTEQPFYGLQALPRRKIFKKVVRRYTLESREEYKTVILELWQGVYREEMYQALEAALYFKSFHNIHSWPLYEQLVFSAPWWDTLDMLATKVMGPLIPPHRELEKDLSRWAVSDHLWARRASLLVHLHHKEQTNTDMLSTLILQLAPEEEFFIRKAIGWVLRQYARTDADWVRSFINQHESKLSTLAIREATKHFI